MKSLDSYSSILTGGERSATDNEATPLLVRETEESHWWSWCALRYRSTRKCVSSKAALLILAWSLVLGLWYGVTLNPDLYLQAFKSIIIFPIYGAVAIVLCFFPLAGFLADVKYGRYKTITRSLFLVLVSSPSMILVYGGGIAFAWFYGTKELNINQLILLVVPFGILVIFIPSYVGLAGFTANVVQFGMDQLYDSPGVDRTLFIHWLIMPVNIAGYVLLCLIPLLVFVLLIVTLCLARHRRGWFLIEPGTVNPYRLVYSVTKFAYQHKVPVQRSAFTYCEDEIPRGLDLGKEKYGGSFTIEQVEDVKVFYGILKVLFSFGTVFFLDFAASSVLPMYALHTTPHYDSLFFQFTFNETLAKNILLNNGLVSPLLISICIPVYLCLFRPFISRYIPGVLKRMGLGMVLVLLSLMASFAMDIVAHVMTRKGMTLSNNTDLCMFDFSHDIHSSDIIRPQQSSLFLLVQLSLSALSYMLIYIAVFEFICSQSPHSMKGLLIGLLYAIKGLYQVLATIFVVPFAFNYFKHPSCGFYYYLVNIVVGLIAVAVYVCVAKRYRYRERDEPCNIRRYAEEYYSKR